MYTVALENYLSIAWVITKSPPLMPALSEHLCTSHEMLGQPDKVIHAQQLSHICWVEVFGMPNAGHSRKNQAFRQISR